MVPIQFKLTNWCQFSEKTFNYAPGITAVIAPNGSGKTNMFYHGQFFAWTGKLDTGETKSKMVKWGEEKGGILLKFRDDQQIEYTLSRGVPGDSHLSYQFKTGSTREVKKATEIDELMEGKLNMPLRMFTNISFIQQGSFMKVVNDRQGQMEYFNRITDTFKFQNIRQDLVAAQKDLPDYPDQRLEIEDTKEQYKQWELEKLDAEQHYDTYKNQLDTMAGDKSKADQIKAAPLVDEIQRQLNGVEESRADLEQKEPEYPEEPDEPGITAEQLSNYDHIKSKVDSVEGRIESIKDELSNLQQPSPGNLDLDSVEVLELKKGMLQAAEKSEEQGTCILCGQSLHSDFSAEGFRQEAEQAKETLNAIQKYNQDVSNYKTKYNDLNEELEKRQQELKELQDSLPDLDWLEEVRQQYQNYTNALSEYNTALKKYQEWQRSYNYYEKEKQNLETRLEACVTQEDKDWADSLLEQYKQLQNTLQEWSDKFSEAKAQMSGHQSHIDKLRAQEEKRQYYEGKKDLLKRSSDYLKSDKLPMQIMKPMLDVFNPLLTKYLNQFNLDYTCKMGPEFSFWFNRGDGWKPADRMSGGQKVNLALCSYLATLNMVVPELPLLVMDEPTAHMDDIRKNGLVQALKQLDAQNQNLHIIIITHDEMIMQAADRVVELESES